MIRKIDWKKSIILDDISNSKAFSIGTYAVLGLVSLFMTVLNIITGKGWLTVFTASFSGLCAVNILLTVLGNGAVADTAKAIFALEVLCMFSFFLISGNPEGFSAIWICMLPSLGMIFFNRFRGTGLCIAMFLILVFFLWTPWGQEFLMYDYTATFRARFPLLFVAFHGLAFLLESLRVHAYDRMRQMQDYYQDLSIRDPLTGILNRQGMYSALEKKTAESQAQVTGVVMFDMDHFKDVNDRYGHNAGDTVLKVFASAVQSDLDGIVCRWGGEEFVVIFFDDAVTPDNLQAIKDKIRQMRFSAGNDTFGITVSAGICVRAGSFGSKDIDSLIGKADEALYEAKNAGRNKIVYYEDPASSLS